MRYFICPGDHLSRLCTVKEVGDAYEIVWIVFDFMEDKNSIFTRIFPMASVDGFISNILIRLQKFTEVEETLYALQNQQGLRKSDSLSSQGIAAKVETVHGPESSLQLP